LKVYLPVANHLFSDDVSRHDRRGLHGLSESHSELVLELIADVLPVVVSANVLYELLPRSSHLICGCLVSVIKHTVAESSAEPTLRCLLAGTGVVLASSATTSTAILVATSTAATASSASSAHGEREKKSSCADVTIGH
jgi:hypothetical protein